MLVVVLITKFTHGAYLVVIAMPVLFVMMRAIRRHYDRVARELRPKPGGMVLPSRVHAVVLVSQLHRPDPARARLREGHQPDTLTALTVQMGRRTMTRCDAAGRVGRAGDPRSADGVGLPVPGHHRLGAGVHRPPAPCEHPEDLIAVYIPEYVVGHWWETLLHNQSALRLKARLLFQRGVMVTSVPWQLEPDTGGQTHQGRPSVDGHTDDQGFTSAAAAGRSSGAHAMDATRGAPHRDGRGGHSGSTRSVG